MSESPNRKRRFLLATVVLAACMALAAAIVVPCVGGSCQGGTFFSPAQGEGASGGSGSSSDAAGSTGARREGYSADAATHEAATRLMDVDAEYVAGTVLLQFAEGTGAEQATELIAGARTLEPHEVTADELEYGLSKVAVAAGSTVEDAVVELSGNGSVGIVQPNYLYHVANESTLADDLGLDVAADVSAARAADAAQAQAQTQTQGEGQGEAQGQGPASTRPEGDVGSKADAGSAEAVAGTADEAAAAAPVSSAEPAPAPSGRVRCSARSRWKRRARRRTTSATPPCSRAVSLSPTAPPRRSASMPTRSIPLPSVSHRRSATATSS